MRLAALCVLATIGYALFVQAQQPERVCAAAAKATACDKTACEKTACAKSACANATGAKTACAKSACDKTVGEVAACPATACDKTACAKSACANSACAETACAKTACAKAACAQATCAKTACAASACDAQKCEVTTCATDVCSDACATDFASACDSAACDTAVCPPDCDEAEKLEHLTKAAEHLQAAGLDDHADQVRQCAQRMRDRVLEAKMAELKKLEQEVAALQAAVGGQRQIMLKFQIVEVSVTRLKELGFDLQSLGGSCDQSELVEILRGDACPNGDCNLAFTACDTKGIAGLLQAIERENLARVLAAPTVVTVERRAAHFETIGPPGAGTKIDALPQLLSGGRIKLEMRVSHRELDPSLNVMAGDQTIPGFRVREVDTGAEMKIGQTLAIAGPRQQRVQMQKVGVPYAMDLPVVGHAFCHTENKINEVATLYLVTPELVEGAAPNGPMPAPMTATKPAPEPQRRLMR
jgi:hypothetical protein